MKKFYLLGLIEILSIFNSHAQTQTWRSDKNNEITVHLNSMWNNDFYAYGIGYERTIHKYKGSKNSFLSLQSNFFIKAIGFYDNFSYFRASVNQAQIFLKYNFGYRKIFSCGIGSIIVGDRFFPNPTALTAYKYDLPKAKVTLGLQIQLSLFDQIPPLKYKSPPLPGSPAGYQKTEASILKNWCGGIVIGRYF